MMLKLLAAAVCIAPCLSAITTVTLCGLDNQSGSGVNFSTAISTGGVIYFSCGSQAVIHLTGAHTVGTNTVLMGPVEFDVNPVARPGSGLVFPSSFFNLAGSAALTMNKVTIRSNPRVPWVVSGSNGSLALDQGDIENTAGGFSLAQGSVVVTNSKFATSTGATIDARTVDFENSQFSNGPTAIVFSGGTARILSSSFTGGGRIVCSQGQLTVTGSHFSNLTASGLDQGGAIAVTSCTAAIDDSDFRGNKAVRGGAIAALPPAANQPGSTVSITGSQFYSNSATEAGGAISLASPVSAGLHILQGAGVTQKLTLRHVIFQGNSADEGGAIDLDGSVPQSPGAGPIQPVVVAGGSLDASAVVFSGNSAVHDGGAIHGAEAPVGIARGVFTANTAGGSGGAVAIASVHQRNVTFANSLFVRNTATAGSAFSGNVAQFIYSTIAANSGAAVSVVTGSTRAVSFANSIVSNNGANCDAAGLAASLVDAGHDVQFPGTSCGATIPVADPLLDTLYVPGPGGPAVGAGDSTVCASPAINHLDVLGQYRPRLITCTIGAIEGGPDRLVRRLPDPNHRIPPTTTDFSLSIAPGAASVATGGSATFSVTAAPINGFLGGVTYRVSGVPAGATAAITQGRPASVVINTTAATPAGAYTLVVTGLSGSLVHTATLSLAVGSSYDQSPK